MEYAKERFITYSEDITKSIMHMKKYRINNEWFNNLELVVILKKDSFGNNEGHVFHKVDTNSLSHFKYNLPNIDRYEEASTILIKKHLYKVLKDVVIENKDYHIKVCEDMLNYIQEGGISRFERGDYVF